MLYICIVSFNVKCIVLPKAEYLLTVFVKVLKKRSLKNWFFSIINVREVDFWIAFMLK